MLHFSCFSQSVHRKLARKHLWSAVSAVHLFRCIIAWDGYDPPSDPLFFGISVVHQRKHTLIAWWLDLDLILIVWNKDLSSRRLFLNWPMRTCFLPTTLVKLAEYSIKTWAWLPCSHSTGLYVVVVVSSGSLGTIVYSGPQLLREALRINVFELENHQNVLNFKRI